MNKKSKNKRSRSEKILSVNISNLSEREILKVIDARIKKRKRTVIYTPNTQILLSANRSRAETALLNSASINIPDGTGLVLASRLLGGSIKERIGGIDLGSALLSLAQKRGYRVYLLGAKQGVAQKANRNLLLKYPKLKICGTHHGYFGKSKKENKKILKAIKKAKADMVFVCMGYPAQEKWIFENSPMLPDVSLCIGLGGSLDVWSGNSKRAPIPFRLLGLEWLYRTIKEPHRIRIFIDIPTFLFKVWKSRKFI